MAQAVIGVIGGSGLYEIEGLSDVREIEVDTPFGKPSDALITGVLDGVQMVFYHATAVVTVCCRAKCRIELISMP